MERIGLLRAAMIAMSRTDGLQTDELGAQLDDDFPAWDPDVDQLQGTLLVAMDHPGVVSKTLDLVEETSSHAQQLQYALPIRLATHGR